jgi:hypothetical protein
MKDKPIRLTLKAQRRTVHPVFKKIKKRCGANAKFVWKYLDYREIYTYHAGLATGKDEDESAEYWLERMLSYVTPDVLAALDQLEIDW